MRSVVRQNSAGLCNQALTANRSIAAICLDLGHVPDLKAFSRNYHLPFFFARRSLLLENLVLRQQLAVFKRRHPRPRLNLLDKVFWVAARKMWSGGATKPGFNSVGVSFPGSMDRSTGNEFRKRFEI